MNPYAPAVSTRQRTFPLLCAILTATLPTGALIAQPANDNYANFSAFASATNIVAGTIVGATREPGEDPRFGYSVWWRWLAPSNGTFTFVAEADRFRPLLLIAPTSTNLLVGLSNSVFVGIQAPNRFATEYPLQASAGIEYTIALFTRTNSPTIGDYTLRVVASAPPTVSFVQPTAQRTRHIVGTPLELQANANDPDGQVVRVDFFLGATLLGSTSSPPYHIWAPTDGAIPDRDSALFVAAVDNAGLFRVAGYVPDVRFIAFRRPPPPNDMFDARVALSGNTVRVDANNGGAGLEPGEPASGDQTLWWSWTAPASSNYYVLARGLATCPTLSVFTSDTLSTLNIVTADGNTSCGYLVSVILQAQAGQKYALAVGDNCGTLGGPFSLHILPTTAPPQFADIRIRPGGVVAKEPALELFAVGMRGINWTVEFSTNLQQWQPCDEEFPFGWVDGVSNWADTFYAHLDLSPGLSRFYRLRGIQ